MKTIFDQQVLDKKIIKAKVSVVLDNPFFATLLMRKKFVEDATIETACVAGQTISYNPEWFMSLPHEEMKGVICHEALHTAFLHHTRREGRDPKKWNMACDYAINGIILNAGMALPASRLYDSKYDNMSAEDIYKQLPQDKKDD